MNYTETYRKVYEALSKTQLPHEKMHNASLRITDALNSIFTYTNRQFPEVMDDIMDVVKDFSSSIKIGGYDLDDR